MSKFRNQCNGGRKKSRLAMTSVAMKKVNLLLVYLLVGLLFSACGPSPSAAPITSTPLPQASPVPPTGTPISSPTSTSTPVPTATPTLLPTSTSTPTPGPIAPAGQAWFGMRQGLCALDGEEWKDYTAWLPEYGRQVEAMAIDGQGRLWVSTMLEISMFDGTRWHSYDPPGFSSVEAIAFDGQGWAWFAHFEGVSAFDGTDWITYSSDDFGLGEYASLVNDVTVDTQGRVWVATQSGASVFDGDTWTPYDKSQGLPDESVAAVETDTQGRAWFLHDEGLSMFDGDQWKHYPLDASLFEATLAIDAQGRVWIAAGKEIKVLDGEDWATYGDTELCGNARDIALDSLGRVYVGTDYGVSILDSGQWVHYQQATSGLIGNDVTSVVVSGSGPASFPLPLTEPRVGNAAGRILRSGTPVGGAKVELCLNVGMLFFGSSPCAGQCFYASTTTDSEGRFIFENVPMGTYEYAIEVNGKWYVRGFLGSEGIVVREGETTVIEDYDLAEAEK